MKKKLKKEKIAIWTKVSHTGWLTCPNCKKILFYGEKNEMDILTKWRKQK